MDKKPLTLSLDLVNAILANLGQQPYQQVYQLIAALQAEITPQMKPHNEPA